MPTLINTLRHPEKYRNQNTATMPKPDWIRVRSPGGPIYDNTRSILKKAGLNTVCEEASCPNIGECWNQHHATIMIMGDTCTRACAFCNVRTGKPNPLNPDEPNKVAQTIAALKLQHVVITSVDRDDLNDGGAQHFANTIKSIQINSPNTTIEVLTPDFLRKNNAENIVIDAKPDVFNHNLETVPRLYPHIRPGSRYYHSLRLLEKVKIRNPKCFSKSGLMLGLGETRPEVIQVMDDMRCANVDFLTIGQYLQPTPKHAPLDRYLTPQEFREYQSLAKARGFLLVSSSPLTRSSYHADKDFSQLKKIRAQHDTNSKIT